jgi:hypothetical protein
MKRSLGKENGWFLELIYWLLFCIVGTSICVSSPWPIWSFTYQLDVHVGGHAKEFLLLISNILYTKKWILTLTICKVVLETPIMFGGHLIVLNIPFTKENGCYN